MANVLVIEDDPDIRRLIGGYIAGAGHTVIEGSDGRSGLLEFRRAHVDVVITDIFMPDQDGIETIRIFKKLRPEVKIIAISGSFSDLHYLDAAKKLGADRAMGKPFRRQDILTLISECLTAPPRP